MQLILIVTLVLATLVSSSAGAVKWPGTFKAKSCDQAKCCCPSQDLVINGQGDGNLGYNGLNCTGASPTAFTIIPLNQSTYANNLFGKLEIADDKLTVTLNQTGVSTPPCSVTMDRQTGSTATPQNTTDATSDALYIHAPLSMKFISSMMLLLAVIPV